MDKSVIKPRPLHLIFSIILLLTFTPNSNCISIQNHLTLQNRFVNSNGALVDIRSDKQRYKRIELNNREKMGLNFAQIEQMTEDRNKIRLEQLNYDNFQTSYIYVGNPPQKLMALFDTGSSNTWILSDKVKLNADAAQAHSPFKSQNSTSFKDLNSENIKCHFGSGTLAGHFVQDDVRIGLKDDKIGNEANSIKLKNFKFGIIESQKDIFENYEFDAVVGMAQQGLAKKGVTPILDAMMSQSLLKDNIFAYYITNPSDEQFGLVSDITLGYYDKAKYKGPINWNKLQSTHMFAVNLDDVLFNGKSIGICKNNQTASISKKHSCKVAFDSGSTLISMPKYAHKILNANKIPTMNNQQPCEKKEEFGQISFIIGGQAYPLDNEEWISPVQQTENHKNVCNSIIMTLNLHENQFMVGDVFMRKYYTIFDKDHSRVGLAQSVTSDLVKNQKNKVIKK